MSCGCTQFAEKGPNKRQNKVEVAREMKAELTLGKQFQQQYQKSCTEFESWYELLHYSLQLQSLYKVQASFCLLFATAKKEAIKFSIHHFSIRISIYEKQDHISSQLLQNHLSLYLHCLDGNLPSPTIC